MTETHVGRGALPHAKYQPLEIHSILFIFRFHMRISESSAGVGDRFTGTQTVMDLSATISNVMWGRGIAPVPSRYFPKSFRLGPVRSLDHHSVSKVEILLLR